MKNLGKVIKKYRNAYNLTQEEMSKKLDLSQSTYSRIENDIIEPDINTLYKISLLFDVNINQMIEETLVFFHK